MTVGGAGTSRRTFIYGSCVGRDMFEMFGNQYGLTRGGTVARQSLISAFYPAPTTGFDFSKLKSDFQRTMVMRDFEGSLLKRLKAESGQTDLIVIDLIDERRGIMRYPNRGGVFTRTRENQAALIKTYDDVPAEYLEFGSAEYLRAFEFAAERFAGFLDRLNLKNRTILLDVPLALDYDKLDPDVDVPRAEDHLTWAPAMNDTLIEIYEVMDRCGFKSTNLRQQLPLMNPHHRWGQAPFHYQEKFYREMVERVSEAA